MPAPPLLPPWETTYERAVLGAAALPAGAPRVASPHGRDPLALDLGRALALSDLARRALTHLTRAEGLDLLAPPRADATPADATPADVALSEPPLRRFEALAVAVSQDAKVNAQVGGERGAPLAVGVCLWAAAQARREVPPRLLASALERLLPASGELPLPAWLTLWLAGGRGRWLAASDGRWSPLLSAAYPNLDVSKPSDLSSLCGAGCGADSPRPHLGSPVAELLWGALAAGGGEGKERAPALAAALAATLDALPDARGAARQALVAEVGALWLVMSPWAWAEALTSSAGKAAHKSERALFDALKALHDEAWSKRAQADVAQGERRPQPRASRP